MVVKGKQGNFPLNIIASEVQSRDSGSGVGLRVLACHLAGNSAHDLHNHVQFMAGRGRGAGGEGASRGRRERKVTRTQALIPTNRARAGVGAWLKERARGVGKV